MYHVALQYFANIQVILNYKIQALREFKSRVHSKNFEPFLIDTFLYGINKSHIFLQICDSFSLYPWSISMNEWGIILYKKNKI